MNVWFVIDSIRWTADRLHGVNNADLGGNVGGTEAMTVGLCRHLAKRGHDVTLWATKCEVPGRYGPVLWRSVERELRKALLTEPTPDVIVAVRQPTIFSLMEAQGLNMHRLLWAGDVLDRTRGDIPHLANVDTVVYVSDWQRKQWESVHPPLASQFFSWVTPVALNPDWIAPHAHERSTFIYSSQPDRGLTALLTMWPRIRQAIPDAKLLVSGYGADLSRIHILADRAISDTNKKVGGIETVRSMDKPGYYRHLARARMLLYPNFYFQETNGHVCSEAMATGVVPLVSRLGALPETVPESAGILFDGEAESIEYQDRFVAETIRLNSPDADAEIATRQAAGYEHVIPRCTYDYIADLWDERLRDLPVRKLVATW